MDEEERSVKFRRLSELKAERSCLFDIEPEEVLKEPRLLKDLVLCRKKNSDEWESLWYELYPPAPKDLMQDIKKRMEAYKLAKGGSGSRMGLSFKQKIKWLLGIKSKIL